MKIRFKKSSTQVRGVWLFVIFSSCLHRYSVPPEHGKRLERLAQGEELISIKIHLSLFIHHFRTLSCLYLFHSHALSDRASASACRAHAIKIIHALHTQHMPWIHTSTHSKHAYCPLLHRLIENKAGLFELHLTFSSPKRSMDVIALTINNLPAAFPLTNTVVLTINSVAHMHWVSEKLW